MPISFRRSWTDPDLDQYRDTVVRFIEEQMLPGDEAARKQGHVGHALWRKAGETGLLCTDIPEAWGGGGGDFRHEAVLYEEMARRSLTGMNSSVHSIVAHYFLNHGTEEQKQRYLPRMARGEIVGAIAMTEPGTGSDLQGIRTRAVRDGDHYVINGAKTFISNGFLAGVVLVVCKTDPNKGAAGTSILIVDTDNCPGYRVGRVLDKMGLKAQDTSELFFDEVRVPADQLLGGEEGKGFYQLMADLPYERLIIGLTALAAMEGAYEATLAYVRERKAFGQAIADFQNTRFKLAEIKARTTAVRLMVDQYLAEHLRRKLTIEEAAIAKLHSTEELGRALDELLQLYGGYGYMMDYPIARAFVDSRVTRIYGGTSEVMKELISRNL